MSGTLGSVFSLVRRLGQRLVAPLQRSDGPNQFRLSSVDTATTTYEGDVGWKRRPPATLTCPKCDSTIVQHHAWDDIDCPYCVASFDYDEFTQLELRSLTCPICETTMHHGQRHPERVDYPEWATCDGCRYHWEFKHSY